MADVITAEEFRKRLPQLCLRGNSVELPGRNRDRQIILKSIALTLSKHGSYTERELNAALMQWVGDVGHLLQVDHAALRRALVDEKYLERSRGGEHYHLAKHAAAGLFSPEVDALAPAQIILAAAEAAAAKKAQFQSGQR